MGVSVWTMGNNDPGAVFWWSDTHVPAIARTAKQNKIIIRNMSQSFRFIPENEIWQDLVAHMSLTSRLHCFGALTSERVVAEGMTCQELFTLKKKKKKCQQSSAFLLSSVVSSRGWLSWLSFDSVCSWMEHRVFIFYGYASLPARLSFCLIKTLWVALFTPCHEWEKLRSLLLLACRE